MKQLTKANLANTFKKRVPKIVQIAAGILQTWAFNTVASLGF